LKALLRGLSRRAIEEFAIARRRLTRLRYFEFYFVGERMFIQFVSKAERLGGQATNRLAHMNGCGASAKSHESSAQTVPIAAFSL
jgi:hypothetical protein